MVAVPPDLLTPSDVTGAGASAALAATLPRADRGAAAGEPVAEAEAAKEGKEEVVEAKKSVAVQTMYRESEAQTAPWSPEFDVDPKEEPPEVRTHSSTRRTRMLSSPPRSTAPASVA